MLKNGYIIGKRIRELRQLKLLSQSKLAEMSGITAQYLSQVELGQKNISLEALVSVANSLEVSMDELLYGVVDNTIYLHGDRKIQELFSDCSYYEMEAIYEIAAAAKNAIRKNGL